MYVPAHFATSDADALIQRLARRWAGVLVSVDANGTPIATHLPVLWNAETRTISGHIARANSHWQLGEGRGLLVLNGPEAYVSPSYYPSKAEHGKVVPTWNYEAVHLSGRVEWFDDAARLERVVSDLSRFHERDRAEPWAVGDAPRPYIDALLRGIVGVNVHVDRIEAKRKLSQNKRAADFDGVTKGVSESTDALGREVGDLMRAERALSDEPDRN